jgi:hypothetical protein
VKELRNLRIIGTKVLPSEMSSRLEDESVEERGPDKVLK